jgi:hypothetical protein
VAARPRAELAELLEPAKVRLCGAARCRHVPLAELFHYNRSLDRHYGVHRECFVELIEWCVAAIERASEAPSAAGEDGFGVLVRRFVADMQRLEPRELGPPESQAPPLSLGELDASIPELPASPAALAELAAASAPEHDAEPGSGQSLVERWYGLLSARLGDLDRTIAADVGTPARLPPLVEGALLVHLLGLEDRRRKAVLSAAADRLLVHRFVPAARTVGGRHDRHEPIAVLLVGVIAVALRPWRFEAPPLTAEQRIVLVALLGELATGKSRKLLHQEKQHAAAHAHPESIRTAVNRALDRWPERVHALSPKQRIDRVAAGFRCLGRLRRGTDPRARDLAIVAELLDG